MILQPEQLWNNGREITICDNEFDQRKPVVTIDGSNCAFITWLDSRNGLNHALDLYGNRIDTYGKSLGFGSSGKLIHSMETGNNLARKDQFYNHYLVASDNNSFITAFENFVNEGYSFVKAIKVNEDLNIEWTVNLDHRSCQTGPLIIKGKDSGANIFWNEFKPDQYNVCGVGIDKNGITTWGSGNGAKISCDIMKNSFERILPSGNNRNGIFSNGNRIFLSWTIEESENLFLKELNLTDEFKQCSNITEIQNGVSEGEYTSITTQMNNLVVVYYQSNNIYAYVRKLDDNGIQKGRQRNIISNFPNPFNPTTKVSFIIPSDGFVRLSVYDITGRIVRTIVNEYRLSGSYNEIFDGSNIATGVYFYRLETNGDVTTKKMTLIK